MSTYPEHVKQTALWLREQNLGPLLELRETEFVPYVETAIARRVYIFVPGINTKTSDPKNWAVRGPRWVMANTSAKAEEYRYTSWALTRRFRQAKHADEIADLFAFWAMMDFSIVGVGHSNGCDLLCRAVRMYPGKIEALHLIAGACEADFMSPESGLYEAWRQKRLSRVFCYCSKRDRAVGWVGRASRLAGRPFGLGYGTLAADGPRLGACRIEGPHPWITPAWRNDFGHSTWFKDSHFETTMQGVTIAERMHS